MRFKVGDVVVLVRPYFRSDLRGIEGTIFAVGRFPPGYRDPRDGMPLRDGADYLVNFDVDGVRFSCCDDAQLAPKRPPATELGSWHEIERITGWHPEREVA